MVLKRLILAGAVVGVSVALSLPRSSGDRTVFVVSGGDLKRSVTFDSDHIGPARGWWWHAETRAPLLTGPRYRLRFHDSASPSVVTEWIYVPQASGAMPSNGGAAWMAFTPAFNADVISQMSGPLESVDGPRLLVLLATGAGILLMMTAAGFQFDAMPLWILRRVTHHVGVAVASDAGPAFLYTSVPRELWPSMGRLGRAPGSRPRPH